MLLTSPIQISMFGTEFSLVRQAAGILRMGSCLPSATATTFVTYILAETPIPTGRALYLITHIRLGLLPMRFLGLNQVRLRTTTVGITSALPAALTCRTGFMVSIKPILPNSPD